MRKGEAAAGREAGSTTVYCHVHVGVVERADGVEAARRDVFSYAVVDAYARNFARAGYADSVAAIGTRRGTGLAPWRPSPTR